MVRSTSVVASTTPVVLGSAAAFGGVARKVTGLWVRTGNDGGAVGARRGELPE